MSRQTVDTPVGVSSFVTARGLSFHLRVDGEGEPTLAYLNSLGSDLRIWDGVVSRLRGRHVRHDKRGHGLSDAPGGTYSIGEMAGDLEGILDALGVERVVLVGISIGGLIALRAALDWPERIDALVVCDSDAKIGSSEAWTDRIEQVEAGGIEEVAAAVVPRWFSPGFGDRDPATLAGHMNMLSRTPGVGYAGACAALRDEDLRQRLEEISHPTLVLCGSDDQSTTPQQCRGLAQALPNGRYREIARAGHLPCVERPEETANAIREFVEEVAVAG